MMVKKGRSFSVEGRPFFMKRTGARHANLPTSRRRILKPRFVQTQQLSTNSDLRRTRVSS